jgi:hypothetical protein
VIRIVALLLVTNYTPGQARVLCDENSGVVDPATDDIGGVVLMVTNHTPQRGNASSEDTRD